MYTVDHDNVSSGPLSGWLTEGGLRKIRYDGREIVQRLYFAVRNKDWLNVPYIITGFRQEESVGSKMCSYKMTFDDGAIEFETDISVTMSRDTIIAEARGIALSSFLKNRIGFCINLPITLSGTRCKAVDPGGKVTEGEFPVYVAPRQPFRNMSAIEWNAFGAGVEISFEGDIFEMEDQRNWTDASYKIYSTPLELPFPAEMRKGDLFYQKITIKACADGITHAAGNTGKGVEPKRCSLPELGLYYSPELHDSVMSIAHAGSSFGYYRADIRFAPGWKEKALSALRAAVRSGVDICFYIFFGADHSREACGISQLLSTLSDEEKGKVRLCLLSAEKYVLPDEAFTEISGGIRAVLGSVPVGMGTDANFAQLNRNRPDVLDADFVVYAIHPQEHAGDQLSIIENIYGQYDTVKTTMSFSGDIPVYIGALSLFRRFNANNMAEQGSDGIPLYDFAGSAFEAGWFVGSIAGLAEAGARSVVCCCRTDEGSELLCLFAFLGSHTPDGGIVTCLSDREDYSVLLWTSNGEEYGVAANHTPQAKQIEVCGRTIALKPYAMELIG